MSHLELEHLDPRVAALATMKACSLSDVESLVTVETALALSFLAGMAVVEVVTLSLAVGTVAVLVEVSTMCCVQARSVTVLLVTVVVLALTVGALVLARFMLISIPA